MPDYTLDRDTVRKAYKHWSAIYDALFGAWLAPGRRMAIEAVKQSGSKILDVGVGTGLALADFGAGFEITGIDLSEDMLAKAREKAAGGALPWVKDLRIMDATQLQFEDNSFDGLIAEYVVTLIPDAEKALDEFVRVVKPGGEIVLVNYFAADKGPRVFFDHLYGLAVKQLGLTTRFELSRIRNWLATRGDVAFVEQKTAAPLGLFTVLRLKKQVDAARAQQDVAEMA